MGRVDGGRADTGRSPVFSSRAVRDAAVVTSTIETIRRYVAGEEQAEGLTRKLQSLSAEQFGFLQISIDPALAVKALGQVGEGRSAATAVLRRLLADISDGGKPPDQTPAAALPPSATGMEAEMSPAPAPVAPPVPPSAAVAAAPLSVPVRPAPAQPVPTQPAPGPQPSRAGPLFTSLGTKGREAPAGQAEMRAVPTPTPRVPGAMSLRAAPPTPVRPSAIAAPLPTQPLSTPNHPPANQPAPARVVSPAVTVPGAIRMASAPAIAARVTLHSFKSTPAQSAPVPSGAPAAVPVAASAAEVPEAPSLATPVVVETPPQASSDAPVPPPQPPVSRPPASTVPRLPREQADKRRARLLEAIAGDL
ncbi:hypothetical protein [Nitrospirillum sp. BR 11163]|uniref:hypothetical protein n=1 Tax=Nitrospirillum sp. BR 11163 TaxID=3104323 RepID=UPI002AFEB820|nr:hypothetical protein [Nitrospirillum sp. BR 11163]MEA1677339.1 hypothetical protein [Nitrospirillum sp. BR 11163]